MAIVFGALVGLALGLTAAGGSLLAVPLLVYGLGLSVASAVPTALIAIALTAAVGASDGARARLLDVRAAMALAAGGVVAAPAGVMLAEAITQAHLLLGLGVLMLLVGTGMAWHAGRRPHEAGVVRGGLLLTGSRREGGGNGSTPLPAPGFSGTAALVLAGLAAGSLSGLFGVGGGFLMVPALTAVTRLDSRRAVATSLLALVPICLAGTAAAYTTGREIPWFLTGLFVIGGVAGMGFGRRLAGALAGAGLQRLVAVAVLALAAVVLADPWLGRLTAVAPQ